MSPQPLLNSSNTSFGGVEEGASGLLAAGQFLFASLGDARLLQDAPGPQRVWHRVDPRGRDAAGRGALRSRLLRVAPPRGALKNGWNCMTCERWAKEGAQKKRKKGRKTCGFAGLWVAKGESRCVEVLQVSSQLCSIPVDCFPISWVTWGSNCLPQVPSSQGKGSQSLQKGW